MDARLPANLAGNGGLGGAVAPFGDNPSLTASLQASLSENSGLPLFLRNLVGGPLSRSTSESPQRSPTDSPSSGPHRHNLKYGAAHSAADDDEDEHMMHDDYQAEEFDEECDVMDENEAQDLRVSSKHQSPEARSSSHRAESEPRELHDQRADRNGLVTYKELHDDESRETSSDKTIKHDDAAKDD